MIGEFCTSDVENYGDLLYPVIFPKIAKEYGLQESIRTFGFLPGSAPMEAGYQVAGINELLLHQKTNLEKLFIGGGDIIRSDWMRMVSHYENRFKEFLPRSFFAKVVNRLKKTDHSEEFLEKFMGYDSPGPFILNKKAYPHLSEIVYFSCGVPFDFLPHEFDDIRAAFDSASFIYMRDHESKNKLLKTGIKNEIHVAPDAIVKISDFFDFNNEKAKGANLLNSFGVNTKNRVVCFQSISQNRENTEKIIEELSQHQKDTDAEIVLMPIGYCHHDHIFLSKLAQMSGGRFKYLDIYSIFDMISVIAACDFFVGTSMHGNITAFSFGIPHLFGSIDVDKIDGFLQVVGLPEWYKLDDWADLSRSIGRVGNMGKPEFLEIVRDAKKKVDDVCQAMLSSR